MNATMEQNMLALFNGMLIVVEIICLMYYLHKYWKGKKCKQMLMDKRFAFFILLLSFSGALMCFCPSIDVLLACLLCESLYAVHFSLKMVESKMVLYEAGGLMIVSVSFCHFDNGSFFLFLYVIAVLWCAVTDLLHFLYDKRCKLDTENLAVIGKSFFYFLVIVLLVLLSFAFGNRFASAKLIVMVLAFFLLVHEVYLVSRHHFLIPSPVALTRVQGIIMDCIGEFESSDSTENVCDRIIFERVNMVLQRDKIFLNPSLTVEDLAHAIYSNKSYVSRSIRNCGHTNFCTFINNLRVDYAMDEFKKDTNLKISTLAMISGFKTVQTFTNAFKDVMSETPTEWCKYYKSTVVNLKKV